jgi:hypothetical protein
MPTAFRWAYSDETQCLSVIVIPEGHNNEVVVARRRTSAQ